MPRLWHSGQGPGRHTLVRTVTSKKGKVYGPNTVELEVVP